MPTISSTLRMFDAMSRPLQNITQGMNLMVSSMRQMQSATERNTNVGRTLVAAQERIAAAEVGIRQAIDQSTRAQERFNRSSQNSAGLIHQASGAQDRFNGSAQTGARHTNAMLTNLKGIVATYISLMGLRAGMNASDDYISTQARLKLINDGSQTDAQLQGKIFAAAERARGNYSVMANSAGKLGLLAGDAFTGNNEIIRFTELMQKSFKVGGSSTMEQQSGMYQLTQAMAAGKLQGDEFRSIMENAPMLASAIADFTGKSKGELKKMSAEGTITADIIKGALFNAADDINSMFATMPMTFGDVFNKLKNNALQAFGPVIEKINSLINSPGGAAFIDNLTIGINILARAINGLISGLILVGNTAQNNWGIIEPIIWGVVGALIAYNAVMGIAWLTTLKDLAAKGAHAIASWAETAAIIALIIAQDGLNAALLACPITWIIIAVILLIAMFYVVVAAINKFAGTSLSATGLIFGAFAVLGIGIWNIIVGVINAIIQFLWTAFVEPWISIIEWVLNVFSGGFDSFGDAVANLLGQIISWFLSLGKVVTKIIDAIFGTNWTAGLSSLQDSVLSWGKNDKAITLTKEAPSLSDMGITRGDFSDAWNAGYNVGENLTDKFSLSNILGTNTLTDFDPGNIPNIGKVGEVGKIKDKVDISSEDLKLMRELAEMKNIQNFVTLTPTVAVTTGDIHNGQSVDTIVAKIKTMLETDIASSASNVYG